MSGHWVRSKVFVQNKGSLGENVTFDLSVSALNAGIWKKIVKNGKNDQFVYEIETKSSFLWQPSAKNMGSLGESDRRAHISQKRGVFGWQQRQSAKICMTLSDSRTEKRGSLEPYIRVTSIMGVPPGPKHKERIILYKDILNRSKTWSWDWEKTKISSLALPIFNIF